ncbi:MAG: hypothetical protein PGN27_11170 [Mycolicibacterium neoaurum]
MPRQHIWMGDQPARLPDLRPANFVSGLESMPVVFTPTARVLG